MRMLTRLQHQATGFFVVALQQEGGDDECLGLDVMPYNMGPSEQTTSWPSHTTAVR